MESLIPIWITSSASVVGVIYAIVRNGHRGKKQDEELKRELKNTVAHVVEKLDDPISGLSAIRREQEAQALHCANISGPLSTRVETNSREIANLRKIKER